MMGLWENVEVSQPGVKFLSHREMTSQKRVIFMLTKDLIFHCDTP